MIPDISVSIVNINRRELLLQCLESLYQTAADLNLEVFVVNNACTDGSAEAVRQRFPQVDVIEREAIQGFSSNNNLALRRSRGRYLLLLNNDTILHPGALQELTVFLNGHPEAAVVAAQLLDADGALQYSYDYAPSPLYEGLRPVSEHLRPRPKSNGQPLEVEFVSAACMLVRAAAAQQVGYFDVAFDPWYSEDADWCYRFRQAGWKIFILPAARVTHLGEVNERRFSAERYEIIYKQKARFFRKHSGRLAVWAYKIVLFVNNIFKLLYWSLAWLTGRRNAAIKVKIHAMMVRRSLSF
jgi:N-acetylglucosaminyl-diphospho-decaprenol L-rhamnosyltransferase